MDIPTEKDRVGLNGNEYCVGEINAERCVGSFILMGENIFFEDIQIIHCFCSSKRKNERECYKHGEAKNCFGFMKRRNGKKEWLESKNREIHTGKNDFFFFFKQRTIVTGTDCYPLEYFFYTQSNKMSCYIAQPRPGLRQTELEGWQVEEHSRGAREQEGMFFIRGNAKIALGTKCIL